MTLSHILRKCTGGYKLDKSKKKKKNQPLTYKCDIKLFAKNEKELETLIKAVRICSDNIEVGLGIEKCGIIIVKSRKQQMTKEIELVNQGKIRMLGEKQTYKYLGVLGADIIKMVEMKK